MKFLRSKPINALLNIFQEKYLSSPIIRAYFLSLYKSIFFKKTLSINSISCKNLQKYGFQELTKIERKDIYRVFAEVKNAKLYDPWKEELGSFYQDNIPNCTHVAKVIDPAKISSAIDILKNNHEVLNLANNYFRVKYILDSIDIWWSIPNNNDPEEAENFHRDKDSIQFLKWFVYLTDVNDENGPHEYAIQSHNSKYLVRSGRFEDVDVYNKFKTKRFYGDAGTNFIENTYGLHRGFKPKNSRRLVLQFRFSIHPSIFRYRKSKSKIIIDHPSIKDSFITDLK